MEVKIVVNGRKLSLKDVISKNTELVNAHSQVLSQLEKQFIKQLPEISTTPIPPAFEMFQGVLFKASSFFVVMKQLAESEQTYIQKLKIKYVFCMYMPSKRYGGKTPVQEALIRGTRRLYREKLSLTTISEKALAFDLGILQNVLDHFEGRGYTGEVGELCDFLEEKIFETIEGWSEKLDTRRFSIMKDVVRGDSRALDRAVNGLAGIVKYRLSDILKKFKQNYEIELVDPQDEYDPKFLTPNIFTPHQQALGELLLENIEKEAGSEVYKVVKYRAENLTASGKLMPIRDLARDLGIPKSDADRKLRKARPVVIRWLQKKKKFF